MRSTDLNATPQLRSLQTRFISRNDPGDFLYVPRSNAFASIDQAVLTALQNTMGVVGWRVAGRTPYGVRFQLVNGSGQIISLAGQSATVDVSVRGLTL
jgi:hypothetical protein